jgi:acetyl-CoA carboxylase alpha subunit
MAAYEAVKQTILRDLNALSAQSDEQLIGARREKFYKMGEVKTSG